jgi:hypothetical protein
MPIYAPPSTTTPTTPTSPTTTQPTTGGGLGGGTTSGIILYTDPNPTQPGTSQPRLPLPGEPAAIAQELLDDVAGLNVSLAAILARIAALTDATPGDVAAAFDPATITQLTARVTTLEAQVKDLIEAGDTGTGTGFGNTPFGLGPFGGPAPSN